MNRIILLTLLMFSFNLAHAQSGWVRFLPDSLGLWVNDGIIDPDGKIYLTGSWNSGSFLDTIGGMVAKFDPTGQSVWMSRVKDDTMSFFNYLVRDEVNGNLYAVGSRQSSAFPHDWIVVATFDSNGVLLNQRVAGFGLVNNVSTDPGGGAWVFGFWAEVSSPDRHIIYRLGSDGSQVGGGNFAAVDWMAGGWPTDGRLTPGKDLLLYNGQDQNLQGPSWFSTRFEFYKVDTTGNLIWRRHYTFGTGEGTERLDQTADGGFIFTGRGGFGGGQSLFLMKTDSLGIPVWSKSYSVPASSVQIKEVPGDGIYLTGDDTSYEAWIMKLNSNGGVLWAKTLDRFPGLTVKSLRAAPGGGVYGFGNAADSVGSLNFRGMFFHIDSLGDIGCPLDSLQVSDSILNPQTFTNNGGPYWDPIQPDSGLGFSILPGSVNLIDSCGAPFSTNRSSPIKTQAFDIYPNPANGEFSLKIETTFQKKPRFWSVMDLFGKQRASGEIYLKASLDPTIRIPFVPSGFYIFCLKDKFGELLGFKRLVVE